MALESTSPFVWGAGGRRLTPEEIATERKAAATLGNEAMSTAPIGHWSQGLNRVLQGLMAGYDDYRAGEAAKQNSTESSALIQALLGGGSATPIAATVPAATTPSVSTPMGTTTIPAGKSEFISSIMPLAQEAAAKTGLDPRLIVAQAALESGWGKSAPGNNLFGIKSHGMPGGNVLPTTEVVNGQPVTTQDSFRAYASPADSVAGYTDFILNNRRYAPVRAAQGLEAQAAALGQSGYATDPAYGQKVLQIAQSLPGAPQIAGSDQPSPLDTAQWPAGPDGAPVNGVDPAALPSAAQPAQGQLPTAQAVQAASQPGRAAINPAIIQAMTSPYVSDQARQIATMLFKSQMDQQAKASDPLRALQIQEARTKLAPIDAPYKDADGNLVQRDALGKVTVLSAADKAPSSVSEYKFYREEEEAAGRKPMPYGQWDTSRKRAGATNVNTGTIPQGYEQYQDPVTGALRMRPIPGGPKDTAKADAAKAENRATSTDIITGAAQKARDAINSSTLPATGTAGALLSRVGETGAAEVYRQVEAIKANAKVENLQAMRAASPTGGALGAVSDSENAMLAAKAGALDPKSPNFLRDLADYERSLLRTIHGKEAGDKIYEATRPSKDGWSDVGGVKIRRKQ